jgi:hypothetical protein
MEVLMKEYENTAGGMSYRTMGGIDFREISKYLEGSNQKNSLEILNKNKEYYIASANKTIARLELSKERVKNVNILPETSDIISDNIFSALEWLEKLKKDINNVNNESELLKRDQYKKWHAVKLLPSAVEGLMIMTIIEKQLCKIDSNESISKNLFENISYHLEKQRPFF